ncbi:MAG: hypothetical protein ACPLZF_01085 [Nitrososphaeria archaeon]
MKNIKVTNFCTKCTLLILIMMLTIAVPKTYAVNNTYTGPNTFFMAYKSMPLTLQTETDGEVWEMWTFAIRDLDTPIGKASLSDFELLQHVMPSTGTGLMKATI